MLRRTSMIFIGLVLILAPLAHADDWKPPADKKFTEEQLVRYMAALKESSLEAMKITQDVQAAKTDATRIAALSNMDQRMQACLDRNKISKAEYDWMGNQAMSAYGAIIVQDTVLDKANTEMAGKAKQIAQQLTDAQARLATYQQAAKDAKRVMTREDRDSAIKSAKDDQQSALDDAKTHADEIKAADDEAKQRDADAKAADALAANPPADVSNDDKPSYIEGKKSDAQNARDAAKEAHSREADAQKAQADAMARAATAAAKAANPDVPVTDDEKASVKSDNDAAIAQAKSDIDSANADHQQLQLMEAQLLQMQGQALKDLPSENVALMRKHLDDYKAILDHALGGGSTTQPTAN